MLFSDIHGHPVFSATMSRQRFQFILANLTFDDAEDRPARWQCDRFASMQRVFEECNKSFARVMIPECYLCLDETLYPRRTQINFRKYNPDKPAKYGMLFKSINSATYPLLIRAMYTVENQKVNRTNSASLEWRIISNILCF